MTKLTKSTPLVNEKIPFSQILLVGEEKIVLSKQEALQMAQEKNLSLLCVAPTANPPVCKLVDYQKYLFALKKKKTKKTGLNKEIRISFRTAEQDLQIKLTKIHQWLDRGLLVKVRLLRKNREKLSPELAQDKCQKLIAELKAQSAKIELQGPVHPLPNGFYFFVNKTSK